MQTAMNHIYLGSFFLCITEQEKTTTAETKNKKAVLKCDGTPQRYFRSDSALLLLIEVWPEYKLYNTKLIAWVFFKG